MRGRGLDESCREVPSFGQEKGANLRDVGPRRDVDEIILRVRSEVVAAREFVEALVHLLEVPGVGELDDVGSDGRLGRYLLDVTFDGLDERRGLSTVEQLQAIDEKVLVL